MNIIVRSPGPQGPTGTGAPLNSPAFTGNPTAATQPVDDNSTRLANTAFVQQEILNDATKAPTVHTHTASQVSDLMSFLSGRILSGSNVTVTYNAGAGTLTIASTGGGGGGGGGAAFSTSAELRALLSDPSGTGANVFADSPALTGAPTTPTASADTSTQQIASTAFVQQEILNDTTKAPLSHNHTAAQVTDLLTYLSNRFVAGANATVTYNSIAGTWTIASSGGGGGGGGDALVANPLSQFAATTSAQLRSVLSDETGDQFAVFSNSPAFTGTPTTPTASPGTNTTQIASTAFVTNAVASSGSGAYSLSYAASVTPVLTSGSLLNVGTLTGAITINAPTGTPVDGQRLTVRLNQDATGGRVITWNAIYRFGNYLSALDISTAALAENRVTFQYNSVSVKWEAVGLIIF
jgi:hypothetical protein